VTQLIGLRRVKALGWYRNSLNTSNSSGQTLMQDVETDVF